MGASIIHIRRLVDSVMTDADVIILKEKVGTLNITHVITERGRQTTKNILEDDELSGIITTVSIILPDLNIVEMVGITLDGFQELYKKDVLNSGLLGRTSQFSRQEIILILLIILYR